MIRTFVAIELEDKETIQEITRTLSEFEPATSTIIPEATRDLLKKLYQYLKNETLILYFLIS